MKETTARIASELASHEGVVYEGYRDIVGVWTWSIGITTSSGHTVWPRYVDNPQTLKRCLEVYEWVLRNNYLPDVLAAFDSHELSEEQLGAALSFHYNTGGIGRAAWVKSWKRGETEKARRQIMNWSKPAAIIPRRRKEQALFFDGVWSGDGYTSEFDVRKPAYSPVYVGRVKIIDVLKELLD